MGGYRVPGQGSNDDGYDEDGYDESQRAEILESTHEGPGNGTVLTDLDPDLGAEPDEDEAEELNMVDDELGEEDPDADLAEEDVEEDEVQEDLDNDAIDEAEFDEELDDEDDAALEP